MSRVEYTELFKKEKVTRMHRHLRQLKHFISQLNKSEINSSVYNNLKHEIDELEILINSHVKERLKETEKKVDNNNQLEKTNANLFSQINSPGDLMIWSVDTDLKLKVFNDAFRKVYKQAYRVDVFAELNIIEAIPEKDRTTWRGYYEKALLGEQISVTTHHASTIGFPKYTETTFYPISSDDKCIGVACFARDITKKKEEEDTVRSREEKYRNIFESMSDIYFRIDINGIIEDLTFSFSEIFGYIPEEVIGRPIKLLFKYPQEADLIVEVLKEKGELQDYEIVLITIKGEEKTLAINATFIYNLEGEIIGCEGYARNITLRKIAENKLSEKKNELKVIFDNAPSILFLVNEEGKVINTNKLGSEYLNGKLTETRDILAREALKCINADSKEGCGRGKKCASCFIRKTLYETIETKRNVTKAEGVLSQLESDQHEEIYFQISTSYIKSGGQSRILVALNDITEIKKANQQILMLSIAVEQSSAIIEITDLDGKTQYVNPQFERSTGYSPQEVVGKKTSFLRAEKFAIKNHLDLWSTITSGKTWQGEYLNVKKDGKEFWEHAIISPIYNKTGKIARYISVREDITERKRIQQELVRSEKDLKQNLHEKDRFISILAHDLKGLVGNYHSYSELIYSSIDAFDKSELKCHLQNLIRSSDGSLRLLNNLLEWGKASLGRIQNNPQILHLNLEVEKVFEMLKDIAGAKSINLIDNTNSDVIVNVDPHILQTILRNLINNAIKFTPMNGDIIITYKEKEDKQVEVSVADMGIGIEKETLEKLFMPGEYVVKEGTNKEKGTGLGLLICEEMVKCLRGKISVESEFGKGSRFYFTIPPNTDA